MLANVLEGSRPPPGATARKTHPGLAGRPWAGGGRQELSKTKGFFRPWTGGGRQGLSKTKGRAETGNMNWDWD